MKTFSFKYRQNKELVFDNYESNYAISDFLLDLPNYANHEHE